MCLEKPLNRWSSQIKHELAANTGSYCPPAVKNGTRYIGNHVTGKALDNARKAKKVHNVA